jgi:hypothetical protein
VKDDAKYKAFKNAVGAVDGVLVNARVPANEQPSWRCRKGYIAQNVLAAVNFRFRFFFVLAGWEGSAHDTRVYMDAYSKGLALPDNKYLLADAGYGLQKGLMTPFRGVRYHLKEQALASQRPGDEKELYNLRHASLRNIIERIFGCLKRKFRILSSTPKVELKKQVQLVYSLCMLWNFIRKHEDFNPFEDQDDLDEVPSAHSNTPSAQTAKRDSTPNRTDTQETAAMKLRRHRIATKLWEQYVSHTSGSREA